MPPISKGRTGRGRKTEDSSWQGKEELLHPTQQEVSLWVDEQVRSSKDTLRSARALRAKRLLDQQHA